MSDLQIFLDHWMIYRNDGSYVLNGKYEDFYQALESLLKKSEKKPLHSLKTVL